LDYAVDLRGDELALRVLRAEGASPACGTNDLLASHAIYESAPFTRTP
jgi:hypothetical protein